LNGQEVKPYDKPKGAGITGERRVFTGECKERAVEPALKTDRKGSEIARELGINGNMLAR
jgi:transposase-like protein